MKPILFLICFITCIAATAQLSKKPIRPNTKPQSRVYKKPVVNEQPAITLTQRSSYAAKGSTASPQLFIADPTIRSFNDGSWQYNGGKLPGVARGTYGFANGQLFLRSTDATTSGGITGSGSVGTGSSAGSVSMGGFSPGVNGKSRYAGPAMWGSAHNLALADSALQRP